LKKQVEDKKEVLKKPEEKQPEKQVAKDITKILQQVKAPKPVKTKEQRQQEVAQKFSKLLAGDGSGTGSLLGGGGGGVSRGRCPTSSAQRAQALQRPVSLASASVARARSRRRHWYSRGIAGIGTAGRLGGGGMGYGSGVGLGGKKDRGMISLATPIVQGALPSDVIKRVIDQNKQQVRYCYEVELQRNQSLEGRLGVAWIIGAAGTVTQVRIKETTINNKNVENCVMEKIKNWIFPRPAGGGIVEVNYPFVFRAG